MEIFYVNYRKEEMIMKITRELGWIMFALWIGYILHHILSFPVPANVYGMMVMFILLKTKALPLNKVEDTSVQLLKHMELFIIPIVASLVKDIHLIFNDFWRIILVLLITNIITVVVAGSVVQFIQGRIKKV